MPKKPSRQAVSARARSNAAPRETKIAFDALVKKISAGNFSEVEFLRYFVPDSSSGNYFTRKFALDGHAVNFGGLEKAARSAEQSLGYQALAAVQTSRLRAAGAPAPNGTIVAEGDSWFNLPDISGLVPRTLVDFLSLQAPINNIAHWGDTLQDIVGVGEYLTYLPGGHDRYLLFSAGGNDLLGGGRLAEFLRQRVSGDNNPAHARNYIRQGFTANLEAIKAQFVRLFTKAHTVSPATKILVHGYDYCQPKPLGQILWAPLAYRGFDPIEQKALCKAILKAMLDDFNDALAGLAAATANVVYVNLRGTVKQNEWWDELHPREVAAKKLAAKFQAKIV